MKPYKSIFAKDLFQDQVILVTVAHELASLGATVVIAARRLEPLQKVQSEIQSYGGKCDVVHPLNIREADQCYAAVKTILERHKRLDGLVNNAGGQFASPADQISPNGFKSVIDLNLNGTFYMMRAAYDLYMKTHGGSIVTVLAMYENGWYYVSHSAAARAAVANLNVTLAQEWTPKSGVRLNAVVPGAILGAGQSNYPPMVQKIVRERWSYENPSARLGTEGEVSSAVVYLLSPGSSYINGVALKVDGGQSFRQGAIFAETIYEKESKIPIYSGFDLDEEGIKKMGMGKDFAELFAKYAKIGKKESKL